MREMKITILLTILAAFCTFFPSNAQVEHTEHVRNVTCDDNLWFSSCLDEPVEGAIVYNTVFHRDKSGSWKGNNTNVKSYLTGCNSGTVYKLIENTNSIFKANDNNDQMVWHLVQKLRLIGKKGEKYTITTKGHMTINAKGDVIVDNFEVVSCE